MRYCASATLTTQTQEEEIFPRREGQQETQRLLGLALGCFLLGDVSYPLLARQQGWEGTVTLHIELLANGTVGTVEVAASSGYPSLDAAAQETVQRWTHTPARRNGIPVTSWTKLNFTFTLKNEAETKK